MYVVVENTPGCLPESDPIECETYADARRAALAIVKELRADGYYCTGNQVFGWMCHRTLSPGRLDPDDLGRVVEIMEVS